MPEVCKPVKLRTFSLCLGYANLRILLIPGYGNKFYSSSVISHFINCFVPIIFFLMYRDNITQLLKHLFLCQSNSTSTIFGRVVERIVAIAGLIKNKIASWFPTQFGLTQDHSGSIFISGLPIGSCRYGSYKKFLDGSCGRVASYEMAGYQA